MKHFLVFGSHPRLSLAEFKAIRPNLPKPTLAGSAALVDDPDWDGQVLMNLLGGTVKLGDIVGSIPVADCTAEALAQLLEANLPRPSIDFGWTVYGGSKGQHTTLAKLALPFKRALKTHGVASRWVTGKDGPDISPAAIAKLKMTRSNSDINLFPIEQTVYIGVTSDVQDADAWSLRDYGRPARDDKNGMLPPKLARMMVNLARVPHEGTLLDPFCGGGTICMEAALATSAKRIIGSDHEAKQISDAQRNEDWLIKEHVLRSTDADRLSLIQSDVRQIGGHLKGGQIDRVVSEGYLGPPLRGHERMEEMERTAIDIEKLWKDTLKSLHPLLSAGGRIVGIWPGFRTAKGKAHVDLEPDLGSLGFELEDPLQGWESSGGALVYSRPEQHVTRRIVVLRKI